MLGGPGANSGEDDSESFPPPPSPTLLDFTLEPQSFPQAQSYLNTQSLPPVRTYSLAPTQPYLMTQSPTPTHTHSQSHMYTPLAQPFTSPQPITPPQPFPSSRPYIPAQPIVRNPTQNYFSPQTNSPSHTSGRAHSPSLSKKTLQNNAETSKGSSKKSNIFTKSGNLLKNAVSSGYALVMPPTDRWCQYPVFSYLFSFPITVQEK